MTLRPPPLDDRDFAQLVDEARRRIVQACPGWTDLSPGDPGMVLLEVFAHLTEVMLYRLNRLPEKAYSQFLHLIGVKQEPPCAAGVMLKFTPAAPLPGAVEIPRGTRVTTSRMAGGAEAAPVFVTSSSVRLAAGSDPVEVMAHHVEMIAAERAGTGTGLPGQFVVAARPPIVAPIGNDLDLVVGVEAAANEVGERARAVLLDGRTFRVWSETAEFTDLRDERHVYTVDRVSGTVTFAPAVRMPGQDGRLDEAATALAEVPAAGREIRLWYCRGGGPSGNVAARVLDTLKDKIHGARLTVTNEAAASGGRSAEPLENALVRGPLDLHSLKRAVTARDFELAALRNSGAIERAKAFARVELWRHAVPGTVEVLLVPSVEEEFRSAGRITREMLVERQTDVALAQIQRALDERRTLGTACRVSWVRYKSVRVKARVVVRREEDSKAVERRVLDRLHRTICPLAGPRGGQAWRFGQTLRDSHVYDIVLAEPGVSYAENVDFFVDEVPDKAVHALASDFSQPRTWYAASGPTLYRTLNDGEGWEPSGRFADEEAAVVVAHPWKPGFVAVGTHVSGEKGGSRVHVSEDCGESWRMLRETTFRIEDMAWALRDGVPVLYVAGDGGLFEMLLRPGESASPVQLVVSREDQSLGFYAVTTSVDVSGSSNVIAAAQSARGVFLSSEGGRSETFRSIGLVGDDIRVVAVQYDGPQSYVWAGVFAGGPTDEGKGCLRRELLGVQDPVEGWRAYSKGWGGGSCRAIAFQGANLLAATHRRGVLALPAGAGEPAWRVPDFVKCGLPLRDEGRLHPVDALATDPAGRVVLAGGVEGVHKSEDLGVTYANCSGGAVESVTLPETWLFVSGEHEVTVEREDEKTGH